MIAVVGTVGLPARYGGFETLVENLVSEKNCELDITVYCSAKSYSEKTDNFNGTKLVYLPFRANGIQSVIYDIASLIHTLFTKPDTILILGVSGCIFLPVFRLLSSSKIVTNIDGLEWKRAKWGSFTKRFLKYSEKLAVNYSDHIIADNQAISDYVNLEYSIDTSVIAYGGDHAVGNLSTVTDGEFALALCRIEPENNVEMILEAFSLTTKQLKFVGNWANSEFGRLMKKRFSSLKNIELLDPIYDIDELSDLRSSCSYYIHGHSAGGTNPSLVEMMHFRKTILCFDCNYNRASTEDKAIYFSDVTELVSIVNSKSLSVSECDVPANKYPDCNFYKDNGEEMLEIAERRYTWKIVRNQYFELLIN